MKEDHCETLNLCEKFNIVIVNKFEFNIRIENTFLELNFDRTKYLIAQFLTFMVWFS